MNRDVRYLHPPHGSQVALLIDGENGPASAVAAILVRASAWGEVTLRRVYGDWSSPQMRSWRDVVTQLGMRAVHQHLPKKNAADIALTADAVDLFYQGFRRFCLVSGDSDYVPLVLWLRERNCLVALIGQQDAPLALQRACSIFISSEELVSTTPVSSVSTQMEDDTAFPPRAAPSSRKPTRRSRQQRRNKRARLPSSTTFPPGQG